MNATAVQNVNLAPMSVEDMVTVIGGEQQKQPVITTTATCCAGGATVSVTSGTLRLLK